MKSIFERSPLKLPIESDGEMVPLYKVEIRDLARGFCGVLFLACNYSGVSASTI